MEKSMDFTIEFEKEADGRWLAEVSGLPGVLAYGQTSDEALRKAEALVLRVIAERLDHGEAAPLPIRIGLHAA
jgi:predicted RNase H-like HicB family nuclease